MALVEREQSVGWGVSCPCSMPPLTVVQYSATPGSVTYANMTDRLSQELFLVFFLSFWCCPHVVSHTAALPDTLLPFQTHCCLSRHTAAFPQQNVPTGLSADGRVSPPFAGFDSIQLVLQAIRD